ncbi:hypothetical protein [Tessaracoccus sp.]
MTDLVLVARARLARASHKGGDPAKVALARQDLAYALLVRAVRTYAPQISTTQIHHVERALALATLTVSVDEEIRALELEEPDNAR